MLQLSTAQSWRDRVAKDAYGEGDVRWRLSANHVDDLVRSITELPVATASPTKGGGKPTLDFPLLGRSVCHGRMLMFVGVHTWLEDERWQLGLRYSVENAVRQGSRLLTGSV